MPTDTPISIEIKWRCAHCGHRHDQLTVVPTVEAGHAAPISVHAGALVCEQCGHMGPIQAGCAVIIGLAVVAASDGAVHMPGNSDLASSADRQAWFARHPSRN